MASASGPGSPHSVFEEEDTSQGQKPAAALAAGLAVSTARLSHWLQRIRADPDLWRAFRRWVTAITRGAAAGFCLRGGLHLVSLALLAGRPATRQRRQQSAWEKLQETLRYALFLGSLAGVYTSVDEGLAWLLGKDRTAKWRAGVAGLCCGPTILLTGRHERHTSLACYVLLRGLVLLVRCANRDAQHPVVRALLAPTRWEHGDTALMCLGTSQLGYSWIIMPSTMDPAYLRFLNYHGGLPLSSYDAVRELTARNVAGSAPGPLPSLKGTRSEAFCSRRPCGFIHQGKSCDSNLVSFLPGAYARALPVYLPVYLLPALLVHRNKLLSPTKGPAIWGKVGVGILRSSTFLALYCALAWRGACCGFAATGTITPALIPLCCWTGGLATLAEKKSRRMELALYVASRAVESFALCMLQLGYYPGRLVPPRPDVLMFSLAAAAILHCYSDAQGLHRDVFRSKYLNVLDFILGNTGLEHGSISHVPSTRDLLGPPTKAMSRRVGSFVGSLDMLGPSSLDLADREDSEGITAFRSPHRSIAEDDDGELGSSSD